MSESGEKGLGLNVPPLDSVFEIISNSIDEAREGFGNKIIITLFTNCNLLAI